MRPLARLALACLALAAALAGNASAQAPADTLARIRQSGDIRLGYLQTGMPFAYADRDGKPAGYSVDLCARVATGIARELGLPGLATTWLPIEPAERLSAVRTGKVDIECGLTTTSLSRMKEVDFSLPIFIDGRTVLVKAGSGNADAYSIVADDFSYEPYGLVVRRNDADFRLAVNRVLAGLYRSGQILEVFDRTFGRVAKPSVILQAMFALNARPE